MAKKYLNWEAKFSLLDMCRSAWKWQKLNPEGYKVKSYLYLLSLVKQNSANSKSYLLSISTL